ncbi:hypothetical protein H1D32_02715 [Anaerobacillus sp. CMMVII]|uniref:hypothetical protein n=1 Tax=Anaerobacillus sp. CMMVII TaxID=2755588 RepID=UPI0021B72B89|nr:hypothetical protein [Anaerobacillus sp. CMMVII]MCT8136761.1 hypothetical protein [Anaerobacillus sp. CMMVII]
MRKRNFLMLMGTIVFTFAIIGGAFYVGQSSNVLTISKDELHISGTYGVDWQLEEITNIELVEELPEIKMRTNGYSFGGRLKGRFRLEELGNGRLLFTETIPLLSTLKKEKITYL